MSGSEAEPAGPVESAEVVLPGAPLDETVRFFAERLGFRVLAVLPADDPEAVVLGGHGLRLSLERGAAGEPGTLRLACRRPAEVAGGRAELVAPNGTRVLLVEAEPPLALPPLSPSFVLSRASDESGWTVGRAGMLYRDLVPDRQGGRFVASHIRIPRGGPVADWVHFHRVRFQTIFCARGGVRVAYEDQGPPFVLAAGDCVLQPPGIRHRVLESTAGAEVVEVSSPARHETRADPELELPTETVDPERLYAGQRFVRHVAAGARWEPGRLAGFEARDTGVGAGSGGLVSVRVARPARGAAPAEPEPRRHDAELLLLFVLAGELGLDVEGEGALRLAPGDAAVVPAGARHALAARTPDLELLEVAAPAAFRTLRDPALG